MFHRAHFWLTMAAVSLCSAAQGDAPAATVADSGLPRYAPAPGVAGLVRAAGDDDMEGLMRAWIAILGRGQPRVTVQLNVGTSATAPDSLAAGRDDIAFVGRKLLAEEREKVARSWGDTPFPVAVAGGTFEDREKTHAEMVWVNADNPLRGLTLDQLDALFGAERRGHAPRAPRRWGDLGLRGKWADLPIHVIRNSSVGASQLFQEVVLRGGAWRSDITVAKPDAALRIAAREEGAIALGGRGFASGLGLRSVALAASDGRYVEPNLQNVTDRSYALSRLVYIYVHREKMTPPQRELLRLVLSGEGQRAALGQGYLPLPADMAAAEVARLGDAKATTYIAPAANRIYAQILVNELVDANPDILVIGLHGIRPGTTASIVIASNLDRVGKADDDDDIAAAREEKTICGLRPGDRGRFEFEMPLKDRSGRIVGALSLIYSVRPGYDESSLFARSTGLRDRLAKEIPDFAALLQPVPPLTERR